MHFVILFAVLVASPSVFVTGLIADFVGTASEDDTIDLEAINGTRDFRMHSKKDAYDKPWFDGHDFRFIHCVRYAKCEKLDNTTCFGSKLPYSMTSLALTNSKTQNESREKLYNYQALRNIPKCWAVIQPFLCAVFAPKCERIGKRDMVYLPSLEMCRITLEPCRVLYNTSFFPDFLKCRESIFPSKCNNDVREMKFNAIGQCQPPLVQADSAHNYYKDIEGCGVQCKDPLYTDEEHDGVHTVIAYGSFICCACNVFVVSTFLIHDWKKAKHPALIIFYINICFLLNWIGWFVQFITDNRDNIVCRRDGTLRHSEPSAGENLSCIIPFIFIYYFLMAAMVWFTIFTYAWYLQTTDRGSVRDRIDKKSSYFHLVAWSMPLVLTITIMALSEVDGNSITGICFVGYRNHTIRIALVLLPVGVMSFISFLFSVRGILQLHDIRKNASNGDESNKLQAIILRMGIRTILSLLCIVGYFVFQAYEFRNTEIWAESLNDLIVCKIKSAYSDIQNACKLKNRPSVAILQLRLLCVFGTCIVISSWCCTPSTFKTWNRFIRKKMGHEVDEDEKFTKPKHKVIADAYAKRNEGVISVSIQNSNTDPAGLNFDMNNLNSNASNGMSSTLMNYMGNIINRRNALPSLSYQGASRCPPCASSCDSEISVSVRQFNVSIESRRSSLDSQVSVKVSETEVKTKVESHSSKKHRSAKMRTKKHSRFSTKRGTNRRTSSSSVESQMIVAEEYKYKTPKSEIQMNSSVVDSHITKNRRGAITAFQMADLNKLIDTNYLNLHSLTTTDDDEVVVNGKDDIEPTNALVPYVQNNHYNETLKDSVGSFDSENEQNEHSEIAIQNHSHYLYPLIEDIMRQNSGIERITNIGGSGTMNETKSIRDSIRSNKNRQSQLKHKKNNKNTGTGDVLSSSLSSIDIDVANGNHLHGSYSGSSIGGAQKSHSRNSKASCDVGIQANAYDIASHRRNDDLERNELPENQARNEDDEDEANFNEMQQLLMFKKREPSIVSRKGATKMNRSEQLRMLLLP